MHFSSSVLVRVVQLSVKSAADVSQRSSQCVEGRRCKNQSF